MHTPPIKTVRSRRHKLCIICEIRRNGHTNGITPAAFFCEQGMVSAYAVISVIKNFVVMRGGFGAMTCIPKCLLQRGSFHAISAGTFNQPCNQKHLFLAELSPRHYVKQIVSKQVNVLQFDSCMLNRCSQDALSIV
jgi:hypothetical protein